MDNNANTNFEEFTAFQQAAGPEDAFFVSSDGPRTRPEERLDGRVDVPVLAEMGNAHRVVDLILSGSFQNQDGSITQQGSEAIRAAVENAGLFQSYGSRASEVQNYINRHVLPPGVSLRYDSDRASANTLMGSRPAVITTIGGQSTRIPLR